MKEHLQLHSFLFKHSRTPKKNRNNETKERKEWLAEEENEDFPPRTNPTIEMISSWQEVIITNNDGTANPRSRRSSADAKKVTHVHIHISEHRASWVFNLNWSESDSD